MAVLIFIRHHENIRRLLKGEEPRIGGGKAAAAAVTRPTLLDAAERLRLAAPGAHRDRRPGHLRAPDRAASARRHAGAGGPARTSPGAAAAPRRLRIPTTGRGRARNWPPARRSARG